MQFVILGCGSSMGVPRPDGNFGRCNPNEKKNHRTRCSALLKTGKLNILIDTSPDLRFQLIKNKIKKIDKVFFSHMHADQTHAINYFIIFFIKEKKTIPVYADSVTSRYLLNTFSYCFKKSFNEYPPILNLNNIKKKMIFKANNKKISIDSIKVQHGKSNSICYIFNQKLAYISDVSEINSKDYHYFKNLKYLIIDCLWYKKHPSHLNLDETLNLINIFNPKRAILTNLHSELDYNELKKKLPKHVTPAFDGLTVNF